MEWEMYSDALGFAEQVEALLYKKEDEYSLFIGILEQIKEGGYEEYYLGIAKVDREIVAVCLMTPPHPLQLISFNGHTGLEKSIAEKMMGSGILVDSIIGDRQTAEAFARAWSEKKEVVIEEVMNQGLYRADSVNRKLTKSPGAWRVASSKDAPLLEEWMLLFERDTGIAASTPAEAARKIDGFLERKEVFVWEDRGEVVSCMKKARPSKHGITVSFVFTPAKYRGRGYARTLVAEVTEELLEEYDFVMLYTDLANSTSNKIYQEIGYEQIANPVHLKFVDRNRF
ncbi:MAG TPA: GNAT family N-acetyltransferase [Planococcus sp. (in: firmicutes)]|nr:GNAT family N-acetyltransferase [Planococcus sp. (in: firmicutes)]